MTPASSPAVGLAKQVPDKGASELKGKILDQPANLSSTNSFRTSVPAAVTTAPSGQTAAERTDAQAQKQQAGAVAEGRGDASRVAAGSNSTEAPVAKPVGQQVAAPVVTPVAVPLEPQSARQVAQPIAAVIATSIAATVAPTLTLDGGAGALLSKSSRQPATGLKTPPTGLGQATLPTTSASQTQNGSVLLQRPVTVVNQSAATGKSGEHAVPTGQDGRKVDGDGSTSSGITSGSSAVPGNAANATLVTASAGPAAGTAQATTVLMQPTPPAVDAGPQATASGSRQEGPASAADTLPTGAEVSGAGADGHPLPSINTARVVESMQGSEMRVGMHSVEFGNVSVSTLLNHQSIAAQISVEHMDLSKALSAHMPTIESRLSSEYGMQAKVEIRNQGAAAGGDSGTGQDRQASGRGTSAGTTTAFSSSSLGVPDSVGEPAGSSLTGFVNERTRLDIRV